MTYNSIGYIAFGIVIYFTIVHLGQTFHKHGRVYMLQLFEKESHLADSINNLLLLGYYLLNLGYATFSIVYWPDIESLASLIACIAERSGIIIVMLGLMHYVNMFGLLLFSMKRTTQSRIH